MAFDQIHIIDATSQMIEVSLRSSTTGMLLTGKAYGDMTVKYQREGAASATTVSVVTATKGAYTSGGFVETDIAGLYQFGIPNGALATGVKAVTLTFACTGALDVVKRIVLIGADLRNANSLGLAYLGGDVYARLGAPAGASVSADIVAVKGDTAAILADTGTDGVKIHPTQGAVTFGQVKILASASGEGAFHIVNSASGSSGKGMYVEGGEQGTMNYASESGGIALRNRATGSFSYGQINESTGASGTGQGNSGAFADMLGDITGSIASVATGGIDTATLTSGALNAIADAFLKRDFSLVTGAASRSALYALRFLRNKWSVSGATLTVMQEDDTTPAWTATLSTDAGADPVIGSDPS